MTMTEPQKQDHERYGHCAAWREDKCPECCPVCGQPDNCGDCDHTPLTDEEAEMLA